MNFRHLSTGATKRAYEAARADHRAEPEFTPAPRILPLRVQIGTWADQPRSGHDNHKRRERIRRKQKQSRAKERAALLARQENI